MSQTPRIISHIIIVDRILGVIKPLKGRLILTPGDYIAETYPAGIKVLPRTRVINLCNDYGYLKTGYYCSLMADARGQRCTPSVSEVIHSNWKRLYAERFAALEAALNDADVIAELDRQDILDIYFGRAAKPELQEFTRMAFDALRLPAMRITLGRKSGRLSIRNISPIKIRDITDVERFNLALDEFSGARWFNPRAREGSEKYWLAILHNPHDPLAPSNPAALKKFIRIGKTMGFYVELITKANFDSLLEFDALFIRDTTAVNNHTYRFAEKAEREGIAVIDDTQSILRCCNKVYLQEMLRKHNIPAPPSQFLYRRQKDFPQIPDSGFPKVLKVPDGAFSLGVYKVNSQAELAEKSKEMFKSSEIILMQDFVKSDFDWRLVTLGGKVIFACKYHMAKGHWQIYNHKSTGSQYGQVDCVRIDDVPETILNAAIKGANIIGTGLYGVDLKEVDGKPIVIEINDNPNIDAGFEDQLLKDELYAAIFRHFKTLIDR
ncbi:RimK family protein [Robiginitomaculum antarcticum]|uniref:RimK family protein n=1 Tax=Robiginitomaculum antarcticum TaxID=437507 RepID=UPI0003671C8F|nr:RimK family protein [Robiginitomaculum antarcticum]